MESAKDFPRPRRPVEGPGTPPPGRSARCDRRHRGGFGSVSKAGWRHLRRSNEEPGLNGETAVNQLWKAACVLLAIAGIAAPVPPARADIGSQHLGARYDARGGTIVLPRLFLARHPRRT